MKIWIDDTRPAPKGYIWCKTVDGAKAIIEDVERGIVRREWKETIPKIELIDTDHDAGDFARFGGDYIKLLDWLEETGRAYPIRIHSMNPVGIRNMKSIIRKNGWLFVK